MILLSGADVVLPDRLLSPGTIAIDGDRIIDVVQGTYEAEPRLAIDLEHHYVVPGFIDVHVHGLSGHDTLDDEHAVGTIASLLPRHGTTAFCPTSIACNPPVLRRLLASIREARAASRGGSARVLPAHLESNFINPAYKGAQPLECLRAPRGRQADGDFSGREILDEIAAARPDVGIVTVAPELDGAIDLIRDLVRAGHHVSLGHSGASYDEAIAGIEAGARQATHLFNRMTPLGHRVPGLAGAVLESEEVAAELVCDGVHVHPAMMRVALAAKGPQRIMAITDGTAGAGLPPGSRSTIGGRRISVGDAAYLDDGTIAGSVLTMDRAFAKLVSAIGLSLVDAATLCATTPARALQLHGLGVIAPGAVADLAVLDRDLNVVRTYIAGELAWISPNA
jgi:N-acetylglucosamine-6-phosphate deacetylase